MNTHALQQIKTDWREESEKKLRISREIQALKWKGGSQAEVRSLLAKRCSEGRPVLGKKALKPFRRPETGPQRHALCAEKRSMHTRARWLLLVKGLMVGRAYHRMERKCAEGNLPSAEYLVSVLGEYLPARQMVPFTIEAVQGWLDGGEAPKQVVEPPASAAEAPKPEEPSLFAKVTTALRKAVG